MKYKLSNILSSFRSSPKYFILGAQKAGTSSLYALLNQHPQCYAASEKEVHYFDLNYQLGLKWYLSHFPLGNKFTGEASPYYLFHPLVPARLTHNFPKAKFIVLLRNPVDRAYSHYHHVKRYHLESSSTFEQAIERELEDQTNYEAQFQKAPNQSIPHHQHRLYLARGRYAEQLKRWFQWVNKEQFLLLSSEDFFENPQAIASRCFQFLELDDKGSIESKALLQGDYLSMKNTTRRELLNYFEPFNKELFQLTSKKWEWNK